jgi:hypothetical protein
MYAFVLHGIVRLFPFRSVPFRSETENKLEKRTFIQERRERERVREKRRNSDDSSICGGVVVVDQMSNVEREEDKERDLKKRRS